MVDELSAVLENGNWSDKDIIIACVRFSQPSWAFNNKILRCSVPRLVGPIASGKSSVRFSLSFHRLTVILTLGPKVR